MGFNLSSKLEEQSPPSVLATCYYNSPKVLPWSLCVQWCWNIWQFICTLLAMHITTPCTRNPPISTKLRLCWKRRMTNCTSTFKKPLGPGSRLPNTEQSLHFAWLRLAPLISPTRSPQVNHEETRWGLTAAGWKKNKEKHLITIGPVFEKTASSMLETFWPFSTVWMCRRQGFTKHVVARAEAGNVGRSGTSSLFGLRLARRRLASPAQRWGWQCHTACVIFMCLLKWCYITARVKMNSRFYCVNLGSHWHRRSNVDRAINGHSIHSLLNGLFEGIIKTKKMQELEGLTAVSCCFRVSK